VLTRFLDCGQRLSGNIQY